MLAIQAVLPARALADAGGSAEQQISDLEDRLFQHEYPNDSSDARLERLEKMVFGEVRGGAAAQRLKDLTEAVPKPAEAPAQPSESPAQPSEARNDSSQTDDSAGSSSATTSNAPEAAPADNEPPPTASQPAQMPPEPDSAPSQSNSTAKQSTGAGKAQTAAADEDSDTGSDMSDYPAVTTLEQSLLGKSFAGEPIRKRLGRLETKSFGHPSGIDDLSVRVAKLKDYVQAQTANNEENQPDNAGYVQRPAPRQQQSASDSGWVEDSPVSSSSTQASPPIRARGEKAKSSPNPANLPAEVSELEKKVFGKTYSSQEMDDRLGNLESSVFPNQENQNNLPQPERVKRLEGAVQSRADFSDTPPPATTYGSQPSYGSQPNYGSQPGYGSRQSYGSQPSYGSQSGYGSQPNYGSDFNGSTGYSSSAGLIDPNSPGSAPAYGSQPSQGPTVYQTYGNGGTTNYGGNAENVPSKGHPLMSGLGKALGAVGALAAGAMSSGMMYNNGYGNPYGYGTGYGMPYGGYGMPYGGMPYGMGMPYGNYSTPYGGFSPYSYGGYGMGMPMMGGIRTAPFNPGGLGGFGFGF